MQLIVAGFHRSGTSLVAQLLHRAGLFMGEEMLGARPSNPFGHFEDWEVLQIHRSILAAHGQNWQIDQPQIFHINAKHWERMGQFVQRRQTAYRNWGFKEPQTCLFLGAWKYLLPDARFLVVYREPGDTVASLETRHARQYLTASGSPKQHLRLFREVDAGLRMWDTYNRAIVAFAREHANDCLLVPFSRLCEGYPLIRHLNERFDADLDKVATQAVFQAEALGGRDGPQWVHDPEVLEQVHATWNELERLAEPYAK